VLLPISIHLIFSHDFLVSVQVDGDLMTEELTLIWDKAPKFPEVDVSEERIDVDAFVQSKSPRADGRRDSGGPLCF
jgi:hypothetical protein